MKARMDRVTKSILRVQPPPDDRFRFKWKTSTAKRFARSVFAATGKNGRIGGSSEARSALDQALKARIDVNLRDRPWVFAARSNEGAC